MAVFEDDPFGSIKQDKTASKSPPPKEVNEFHARSDVDSSQTAQHHTIGIKHDQAAAGDHNHDGASSRKVGNGLSLTVTGSRGGNAALASLITQLSSVIDLTDSTTP